MFNKREKIQTRSIDVSSYECDESHIIVCGELIDRRLVPTHSVTGESRPPMTVHHMRIEIKLSLKDMRITEIESEMMVTPHRECTEIEKGMTALEDECIAPGFTRKVKELFGGRKGCIHLTTLLLAMAPAALQGYWVHGDRNPRQRDISTEEMEHYLLDSCHVWRREGPLAKSIADTVGINIK